MRCSGPEQYVRHPLSISIGSAEPTLCALILNCLHTTSGANNASSLEQMRQEVIKYRGTTKRSVGVLCIMGAINYTASCQRRASNRPVRGARLRDTHL